MEIKQIQIPEICPYCKKKVTISFSPEKYKLDKSGMRKVAMKCPHLDNNNEEHIIIFNIDINYKIRRKYGYLLITPSTDGVFSKNTNSMILKLFKNEALKWMIYQKEFDFFMNNAEILRIKLISNVDDIAQMNNPKISMRFVHMLDENKKLIEYMNKFADIQYFMEFIVTIIYLERFKAVEFLLE